MKTTFMKRFVLLLFLSINTAFASTLTCPPVDVIKDAKFISAYELVPNDWIFTSNPFTHDGANWNVLAQATIDVKSEKEAIARMQKKLSGLALDYSPEPRGEETATLCIYANQAERIFAVTPPLYMQSNKTASIKNLIKH